MMKNIFRLLTKKRKQNETSDTLNVILKTDKKLSEAQKNTIINIVKDGITAGEDLNIIGAWISLTADLKVSVILNRITKNVIEVIF